MTWLDTQLVERWVNPSDGRAKLAAAHAEYDKRVAEDDGGQHARSHVGRAAQRLSEALRLCGDFEASLHYKDVAIAVWQEQNKARATFLVQLQRALVLAELGHPDADATMAALRAQLDADEATANFYDDFWHQYEARRRILRNDVEGAAACLRRAIDLRCGRRADRIVVWTEQALAALVPSTR